MKAFNKYPVKEYRQYVSGTQPVSHGRIATAPTEERTWAGFWHWDREIIFHSKGEMQLFQALQKLEKEGRIFNLIRQPKFPIYPDVIREGSIAAKGVHYVSDFFFYHNPFTLENGNIKVSYDNPICIDYKGHRTDTFIRKFAQVKRLYPKIKFIELTAGDWEYYCYELR